jgi:hypothetical protein
MLKKFDQFGISYGICQEIVAAKFVPRLLGSDQKQWCVNVCLELREKDNEVPTFISISLPPPPIGNETEGTTFETVSDSQAVLDSFKENDFHGILKRGKNYGITVYVPKETIWKEMVVKIE